MVEIYDTSEKVLFSVFYLMVMAILGFVSYAIIKNKLKHPLYKFTLVISIIGLVFCTLWIASIFFPSENLYGVVMLFAGVLLPFLWFFGALGIMIYGFAAIINRKTFVKVPVLIAPQQTSGVEAIYFGVLWVIAGFMMILMEVMAIGFLMCEKWPVFCPLVDITDRTFGSIGNILIILSKPLKWMGLIR